MFKLPQSNHQNEAQKQTRSVLVPHLNIDKDVGMLIIPRILAFIFILFISLVGLRSQSAEQIPKDCIITKTLMTLFIPLRYNFSDRCSVPVLCLIWFLWSTRRLITRRHIWRLEAGPGHSIFLPRTSDVLTVGKWKCNFYIIFLPT